MACLDLSRLVQTCSDLSKFVQTQIVFCCVSDLSHFCCKMLVSPDSPVIPISPHSQVTPVRPVSPFSPVYFYPLIFTYFIFFVIFFRFVLFWNFFPFSYFFQMHTPSKELKVLAHAWSLKFFQACFKLVHWFWYL